MPKITADKPHTLLVRMDTDLHLALAKFTATTGMARSELTRRLLENHLLAANHSIPKAR